MVTQPEPAPAATPEVARRDRPHGFGLEVGESLALGLRRIVVEQVDRSIHLLRAEPDVDVCVHEMRKALKRVRAVLRLVRGELGRYRYREENVVLRDTARRWAVVRDRAVTAAVAADLVADPGLLGDVLGRRLVATLDDRAAAVRQAVDADRQLRIDTLTSLLCFRARVTAFPVVGEGAFPDAFSTVRPGLLRIARRANAGMNGARSRPDAHLLHEWRKDVKYLRHQLELAEPVWPELLGALAARLETLGDLLGDDHDLAVLGTLVATDVALVPDERWRERVLTAVEHRRRRLQGEAFAVGDSVLGGPGGLVDRIGAAWGYARG